MSGMTLFELSAEMAAIEDALIEGGGELTPELEQMLQENQQGLANKVDGYCAIIHKLSYTEDVLDAEIKRLQEKKKVAKNAKERLKNHVCETMGTFGMTKLESNFNTMTRRRSARVEVNEDQLKAAYIQKLEDFNNSLPPYLSAEMKVSKKAISDMQKQDGVLPAGAEIVENYSLIVR